MSQSDPQVQPPARTQQSLAPSGKLGFRGRAATPEERAQVFEAFFFEGPRRIPYLQQFFVLMLLSAAIAALGLANDSAAVVIGAMLVAPLMTPILGIAAALVQGWGRRSAESLAIVGAGALTAITVGVVVSLMTPFLRTGLPLPGELLGRTAPNMIDLGIALAAGAAGGFVAVRTEASGALPGVGIAVALVPPLATVGIAAGLGRFDLAWGALLLFTTNLVAIVLAAGLVFVGAGFAAYRDEVRQRQARAARILVVMGVFLVAIPLAAHSVDRYTRSSATADVAASVQAWAPGHALQALDIERSAEPILVTVSVAGSEALPDPAELALMIADDLGRAVDLEVIHPPVSIASAPEP